MSRGESSSSSQAAVDWSEIRRRLESSRLGAESVWVPDAAESRRILQARARALAREPERELAGESLELLVLMLARETYGVETRHVREVFPLTDLTPLPCTPAFVLGIVNLRGEILSVIDLRRFFDLPERGLTDLNKVVVLESDAMSFGILADSLLGVRRVRSAEIQPALPTLTGIRERYLRGVTGDRMVVLDAEKLLADDEIVVRGEQTGADAGVDR